jgi:hypothetical protein
MAQKNQVRQEKRNKCSLYLRELPQTDGRSYNFCINNYRNQNESRFCQVSANAEEESSPQAQAIYSCCAARCA